MPGVSTAEAQEFFDRANDLDGTEAARALYRDWAPVYEASVGHFGAYLTPGLIAGALAARFADRGALILDVACGTGLVGAALARLGYGAIWGLDLSPEMLAEARGKGCYAGLIAADVMALAAPPLPGPPAALVCAGALTWAHLPAEALERMLSWLPEGSLVVADIERNAFEAGDYARRLQDWQATGVLAGVSLEPAQLYDFQEEEEGPQGYLLVARRGAARG